MKLVTILILALAALTLATGCGGVPGSAVATVDGQEIDREVYDRWLASARKSSEQKDQKALRAQVLQQLISHQWLEAEAEDRGISIPDDEVRKAFEQQRKASFPKDADYEKYLSSSGQTEEDLLLRVRSQLLSSRIREQVTKDTPEVTDKQVADYYEKNKARFVEPERRDLRMVLTRTKGAAERARSALAGGASWSSVAKEHSIDRLTRANGGKLAGVASGDQPDELDAAIFDARKGSLTGPVKTPTGYYLFEVTKVTPATRHTLAEATPAVKGLLAAEGQQKAVDRFLEELRTKWKDKTECGDGYLTKDCGNGP